MLQLNHRCLMFNCFNRLKKNFALHFNFSSKFWIKVMNGSFHLSLELQLFTWVVFFFFDSGTVGSWKNLTLRFSRKIFLLSCFAPAGNRTGVYRVGDDNSTTEPQMLDFYCFNRSNKILLSILFFFYQSFESKSPKLCFILIKASNLAEYLSFFFFFDGRTVKTQKFNFVIY